MTAPVHDEVPEPGSEQPGLTGIVPALNEEKNLEAYDESGAVVRAGEILPPRNATFDASAPADAQS